MLPAAAPAAASATTAASTATAAAVFDEQTLEQRCILDNDATATIGDNERERDDRHDGTGGDCDRRGLSDPGHVPELDAHRAIESIHAASNDAAANSRTTANSDLLVDPHRQRHVGTLCSVVRPGLQGCRVGSVLGHGKEQKQELLQTQKRVHRSSTGCR